MPPEPQERESVSDEALAYRVQTGCTASMSLLCERFWPRLLHVLERRLRQQADAEDVAQLTLVRVMEQIDRYDPRQRFSPWIFTISLRLASDHQRRTNRRGETPLSERPGHAPTPDSLAMDREERDQLWTLAERLLTPDQWTALWLFYGEGHSAREVAHAMRKATFSVRALLYRGRKLLRPHLRAHSKLTARQKPESAASPVLERPFPFLAG